MQPRYSVTIILLVVLVALVFYFVTPQAEHETAVYRKVLQILSEKIPVTDFSFYNHPSTCRGARHIHMPSATESTFDNFLHVNNPISARPGSLRAFADNYHILSLADSARIFAGQKPTLSNLPANLINLSHIGFNADKSRALLCVESPESGDLVYLQREQKMWRIQKWQYVW